VVMDRGWRGGAAMPSSISSRSSMS
jgi:hypothetical protein